MCEFMSWVEKGEKVYFLTPAMIQDTPKGQAWLKYEGDKTDNWEDDQKGHGAIRWFFDLQNREGEEHECTDFSSPANFPTEIVKAIKAGEFRGYVFPFGLLSAALDADYQAKCDALDADYQAKCAPLYADYQAKRAALYADYQAKCAPLYADYQAKCAPLYADYQAKRAALDADYQAKRAPLDADYQAKRAALDADMWDLFSKPENRVEVWK